MAALAYAAANMKINPNDYANDKDRKAALNHEWQYGTELPVYLNRIEYDLERSCQTRDYFIGTHVYQDAPGYIVQTDGFLGFDDYELDMPDPLFRIAFNGTAPVGLTNAIGGGGEYTPGQTLTITIADDSTSPAVYGSGAIVRVTAHLESDHSDAPFETRNVTLSSNAGTQSITIPEDVSGKVFLLATALTAPINSVKLTEGGSTPGTTSGNIVSNLGTIQAYYTEASPEATITLTISPQQGQTLSAHNATIVAQEKNTFNSYEIQANATLPSSVQFRLDQLSLYVDDNTYDFANPIEVSISIVT